MNQFDKAFEEVRSLAEKFKNNFAYYTRPDYQEAEARKDFIDKFFIAMGWDVNHDVQNNPYEQEVKVEKSQRQQQSTAQKRADYAFYTAPNFKDVRFFTEAKKPAIGLKNADHYFQTIRYGWNANTAIAVLTDFEEFHILDCRYKPDIRYVLNGQHKVYHYTDYSDKEKFAEIYWLFSREAVINKSLEKYAADLPKPKGKAVQKTVFKGGYQAIDESFLETIDAIREELAKAFKKNDESLSSEALTEAVTRTIDRLVFIRFLEDKLIEPNNHVSEWRSWKDFISDSRKMDAKYNGVVFKEHALLDKKGFAGAEEKMFLDICTNISNLNSPYDFNYIPIHILGSIYERFLGKVVIATEHRARIEEKPEVRKAGGVYYTPKYIVDYIVKNTIGKIVEGLTPAQIAGKAPRRSESPKAPSLSGEGVGGEATPLRFADIACGSGSFLIGVYDYLLDYHKKYYQKKYANRTEPLDARNEDYGNVELRDGQWILTLKLKQEILLNNIYGVDIDRQAVEVTQLSLFLKMLEDETLNSTQIRQGSLFSKVLPDLSKNIVCGNSLIGTDILSMTKDGSPAMFSFEEEKKLNPMDFETAFPKIFLPLSSGRGEGGEVGFDAIVGNPPYSLIGSDRNVEQKYFTSGKYKLTSYKINTYLLFLEQGLNLIKSDCGIIGLIIPKSLVFNTYFNSTRKILLEKYKILQIVEIREKVFVDAEVGDSILFFGQKGDDQIKNDLKYFKVENIVPTFQIIKSYKTIQEDLLNNYDSKFFPSGIVLKIQFEQLDYFCDVFNGLNPGNVRHILLSSEKRNKNYKKMVLGRDIQKYSLSWSGTWVNYDISLKDSLSLSDIKSKLGMTAQKKVDFALRSEDIYLGDKILVRKTADHIIATFDSDDFYYDSLAYGIKKKANNNFSFYYFLGLLNSKIMNYFHENLSDNKEKVFAKVLAANISKLPIPNIQLQNKDDKFRYDQLVTLVTQMLDAKKQLANATTEGDKSFLETKCNSLDRQIDDLVYKLYGLTEEEIKIVEGS